MDSGFFLGIVAGFLFILLIFLIPAILQIKRTAKAAEDMLNITNKELSPLLVKLQETVESVNHVALKLDESMGNVQKLTRAVGEAGTIITDTNHFMRNIQMLFLGTTMGLGAGIKTAFGVLMHGIIKKGGK